MQDTFWRKLKICLFGMLVITAFLFPVGCAAEPEEQGLTELAAAGGQTDTDPGSGPTEEESAGQKTDGAAGSGSEQTKGERLVCIYVCGAVSDPGIYELDEGARLYEAVEAAGGMTEEASADSVNLARAVSDGEQIYIPTLEETKAQGIMPGTYSASSDTQEKVNINTASAEELMTLTGIGEAKAESIIRYREENGGFQRIEDLMEISGIKEGVFEKIKDDIII